MAMSGNFPSTGLGYFRVSCDVLGPVYNRHCSQRTAATMLIMAAKHGSSLFIACGDASKPFILQKKFSMR